MPTNVHYTADAIFVFDEHGRVVLHSNWLDQRGEMARGPYWLAEEIVHQVDAMRGDIVERPAAGKPRVGYPALDAISIEPIMRGCFRKDHATDRAGRDQRQRAVHLWIHAAVVGDAEQAAGLFRGGL